VRHKIRFTHASLSWPIGTSYDQKREFQNFQIEYDRIITLGVFFSIDDP